MEAELRKLQIDRVSASTRPARRMGRWATLLGVSCALASVALFAYSRIGAPAVVETYRVPPRHAPGPGGPDIILAATGYIIAAHKIEVAAKVSGKVAWIAVEKGDRVQQGQELVRLEDPEYRAQVLQAQGEVDNLRAKLAELERGARPQEIAKAKADFESAKADLVNDEVTLKRTRLLATDGVVARQTLDDAQDRYDAQQGKVSSLEQTYELERLGPREEEIASMRAQLDQAKGVLAYATAQLEGTIICAPVSGTILERNVEKGEFVTTGFVGDKGAKGYVVSLADLDDLEVELDIDQNNFAKLKPSQPAVVTTDAYPDRKYSGRIVEVSPEADRQKATIQVKVKIQNPDAFLRPDMNASVAFRDDRAGGTEAGNIEPGVSIPLGAIHNNAVFVVENDHVRELRVTAQGTRNGSAEVTAGLRGGEEIVVNPPAQLRDGNKVRVKGERP